MLDFRILILAPAMALALSAAPLTTAQAAGVDQSREERLQQRREERRAERLQDRREAPRQGRGNDDDDDFRGQQRQDRARQETREGRRMELGGIVRGVQSGRPGRMLGVNARGADYVVRWEYPGGRVADIQVDGQTGRVQGER